MKLAEFRVYVQVDDAGEEALAKMQDFIRACIGNLDGVNAVEVEPPRGSTRRFREPEIVGRVRP